MISAVEALALPSAQLAPEEIEAAYVLESEIEKHVRADMTRNGVAIQGREKNPNVIAEVNQRLRAAGWSTNFEFIVDKHRLNAALTTTVGYRLLLTPSDESYRTAARAILS